MKAKEALKKEESVLVKKENFGLTSNVSKSESKIQRPLQQFLEKRKQPREHIIRLSKNEDVNCPDCQKNIFDGKIFSGCICFGQDMDKKVFIKKSEEGVKIRFSRGWDEENMLMLLDILRNKNGKLK